MIDVYWMGLSSLIAKAYDGAVYLLYIDRTRRYTTAESGYGGKGIFARMVVNLTANHGEKQTGMVDATHL